MEDSTRGHYNRLPLTSVCHADGTNIQNGRRARNQRLVQNKQRYQELNRQEGGLGSGPQEGGRRSRSQYENLHQGIPWQEAKKSDAQNNKTDKTYKVFLSHIMPPFRGVHDMRIQKTYEEPMNKL